MDSAILLCKRETNRDWYPGVWDLPGGHLGEGEDPATALLRELREELGVEAEINGGPWLEARTDEAHVTIFEIASWVGTVRNASSAEHSQVAWFDPHSTGELELGPLATHLVHQQYGTRS